MRTSLLLTLLFVGGTAQASEWVPIPLSNPNKVVLIDTGSLLISGTVRRAWFKFVMPPHSQKGTGIYADRYVSYALMRSSFDCQQKNSMTDGLQWFYDDGTNNTTTLTSADWKPVPPDSMADALLGYICALKP
jgi:hypothetical protein